MKNLEQLRAAHAWAFWQHHNADDVTGQDDGDVVSGLPAYLMNNGLLATLAFAVAERDRNQQGQITVGGMEKLLGHVGRFLGSGEGRACIIPSAIPAANQQGVTAAVDALISHLTSGDSLRLQRCTQEALHIVRYLKRFAPPKAANQPA